MIWWKSLIYTWYRITVLIWLSLLLQCFMRPSQKKSLRSYFECRYCVFVNRVGWCIFRRRKIVFECWPLKRVGLVEWCSPDRFFAQFLVCVRSIFPRCHMQILFSRPRRSFVVKLLPEQLNDKTQRLHVRLRHFVLEVMKIFSSFLWQ